MMILRPRKFNFKSRHKKRDNVRIKSSSIKLVYGQYGLLLLQPTQLYSKQLFRFKLFLKKGAKRVDKTRRGVWFNAFPHLPLTKKVAGSRMGKGKGKLSGWVAHIKPKTNLFEFRNLRWGRAKYFSRQISLKLRAKTKFHYNPTGQTKSICNSYRFLRNEIFW
uniref:Ribosomal protein L16 n=1 Tax=Strombidium cf. sulcatum TaxID=2793073 RepID=A0A7T0M4X5_9SPIT|nr:ribosomal protein L16 [Strombidium cf. sulcatum]QPL15957.1 ribosomal protein L16 [Strombidium cf. sulcatum]